MTRIAIMLALLTLGLALGTPVAFAAYHGCQVAYKTYKRIWP